LIRGWEFGIGHWGMVWAEHDGPAPTM
jgi:hypothetical protein